MTSTLSRVRGSGKNAGARKATAKLDLGAILVLAALAVLSSVFRFQAVERPATARITPTGSASPVQTLSSQERESAPGSSPKPSIMDLQAEELARAQHLHEAFPQQAQALDLLAHVYNNQGNRTQAMAHWQKLVAKDPGHAGAYDAMARVAFLAEEHEQAVQLWHKTLAISPRMPGVHARLAKALMGLGQMQKAVTALQKALELSPQASASHYMLGEAYRQLGQYEAARERFDAVLRIQPDSVKACYGLATVYMALKQADEAQVCLDKFRKLKAADVQADRDRRSQYDDVQEVRAQIAQTYTQMGILYARQRDLNSAEQLWKRAAELDQRHVECRSNLARFYQQTRQPHKALALCCELAALEPGNGAHPYNMGMMHANLRQFDAALQAFEKARELAPEQSASYRLLAQMFLEMGGDIDQARAHAQQAVTLEARAENYFVLGAVKIKQGDSAGATEALRQALRLEPNNPKYQSTFEAFQKRMQQEK